MGETQRDAGPAEVVASAISNCEFWALGFAEELVSDVGGNRDPELLALVSLHHEQDP